MSYIKQNIPKHLHQESATLRALRSRFHNYSKSQQVTSLRPSGDQCLKSTLKENDGMNWRQTLKISQKNESKSISTAKTGLILKSPNRLDSEFTKKAREILAKNFPKKYSTSNQNITKSTLFASPKPAEKEKCTLISHLKK